MTNILSFPTDRISVEELFVRALEEEPEAALVVLFTKGNGYVIRSSYLENRLSVIGLLVEMQDQLVAAGRIE